MANTMFIANLDLNNPAHVQALATLLATTSATAVPYELRNVSAPAQVSAPAPAPVQAPAPKAYAPAADHDINIEYVSAGRGKFGLRIGYQGGGHAGAKLMVKDAGFKWDDTLKAWVGTTAQAKALGLTSKSTSMHLTAEWVQAGRDKAAAKAARKAAKAQ